MNQFTCIENEIGNLDWMNVQENLYRRNVQNTTTCTGTIGYATLCRHTTFSTKGVIFSLYLYLLLSTSTSSTGRNLYVE